MYVPGLSSPVPILRQRTPRENTGPEQPDDGNSQEGIGFQSWDVSHLCHRFPEQVPLCVGTDRSSVMGWLAAKLGSPRMSLVNDIFRGASERGLLLLLCGEGAGGSVLEQHPASILSPCHAEWHLRVEPRPPRAPQVLRDGRRPAQRPARLLLLPHWLAVRAQAPGCHREGEETGFHWSTGWPCR